MGIHMQKRKVLLIIPTLLFLIGCQSTSGEIVNEKGFEDETDNKNYHIHRTIDNYLHNIEFNGSILVSKEGKIILNKGYGWADFEQNKLNEPDTIFNIASLTKQFTAMAIMQLEERGKLNVQATIDKYISNYPYGNQVTIHHLLSNTSGIPDFTGATDFLETINESVSLAENKIKYKEKPLISEPGSRYSYHNSASGYLLLGLIIERVSGLSYSDYLQEYIFTPLKMNDTGYNMSSNLSQDKHSQGYFSDQYSPNYESQIDMSIPQAAGGLYSTVQDLYLWDQALYTEELIDTESLRRMHTPNLDHYAYGWAVSKEQEEVYYHFGGISGYRSMILRNVQDKSTIIILSNIQQLEIAKVAQFIRDNLNRGVEQD
jgi:CubicO group peptidase (beta-lactamase class C family)